MLSTVQSPRKPNMCPLFGWHEDAMEEMVTFRADGRKTASRWPLQPNGRAEPGPT